MSDDGEDLDALMALALRAMQETEEGQASARNQYLTNDRLATLIATTTNRQRTLDRVHAF